MEVLKLKKHNYFGGLFLLFLLITIIPAYSFESVWADIKVISNPIFEKAFFYQSTMNYNQALLEYQQIMNEHPGTEIAANAQLCKIAIYESYQPDRYKALEEYRKMLQDYPNTRYWLIAKFELLVADHNYSNFEEYLSVLNGLIIEMGGESVFNILNNNYSAFQASQIAPQYQNVIAELYLSVSGEFRLRKQFTKETQLLYFIRANFPKYSRINILDSISYDILKNKRIVDTSIYPEDTTPPQITIDSPHHGKRVHGLKPRIQVDLQDGDIMAAQVNLSKLIFTLDGEDLTDKMKVQSKINTSAQPGVTFEKIRLTYKPESPLAVGTHTVYVKAEDCGGRSSEKTWTFTIVKPELYRDGDDEDN